MLPLISIPTAILWIIAVILAFVDPGPIAGVSHHAYTGGLFALALVLSVVLFFVGRSAESKRTNTLNSFALPLLLVLQTNCDGCDRLTPVQAMLLLLVIIVVMAAKTLASAPHIERPAGAKKTPWYQRRRN